MSSDQAPNPEATKPRFTQGFSPVLPFQREFSDLVKNELLEVLKQQNLSLEGYFDCRPEAVEALMRRAVFYAYSNARPTTLPEFLEWTALQSALRGDPVAVRTLKRDMTREELLRVCKDGTLLEFLRSFSGEEYQVIAEAVLALDWNEEEPSSGDAESSSGISRELIENVERLLRRHPALTEPLCAFIDAAEQLNERDEAAVAGTLRLLRQSPALIYSLLALEYWSHWRESDSTANDERPPSP